MREAGGGERGRDRTEGVLEKSQAKLLSRARSSGEVMTIKVREQSYVESKIEHPREKQKVPLHHNKSFDYDSFISTSPPAANLALLT